MQTDVFFVLTAGAIVTGLCQNNGGNISPGRSPVVDVVASASKVITIFRNGQYVFDSGSNSLSVTLDTATLIEASPTPKEAGCPSNSWDVVGISEADWTFAHLDGFEMVDGTLVPLFSYVFACSYTGNGDEQVCNTLVSKTIY